MDCFKMKPFDGPVNLCVDVPGSKSITNRALLIAALTRGKTTLKGVLFSDDSRVFMNALRDLGYHLHIEEEKREVIVETHETSADMSEKTEIPQKEASIYVGSAGTAARFLTAMLSLSGGTYEVTSSDQMKVRPMRPLLEALEGLGTTFEYKEAPYAFPFVIKGREKKRCSEISLNIDESSQFLSALLLTGVMVEEGYKIRLTGTRDARAYVKISMEMMKDFGCDARQVEHDLYEILPGEKYEAREYQIEPDVSAACYFYAMAAICGGRAVVRHVKWDCSQGDIQFLHILEQMGCSLKEEKEGIVLVAPSDGRLQGVTVDMGDFSDQTMTLAAVAVFAKGATTIRGVSHIRRQESNRIRAIVTELTRMGIACEEHEDGLTINPSEAVLAQYRQGTKTVKFKTYDDHRMAMAYALIGTKLPGVTIENPLCCKKTFENYFDVLTNLGLSSNI